MTLPPLSLRHLRHLTDDTGMIQHARLAVRDPRTGYTADDNSRALIAAVRLGDAGRPGLERLAGVYLGFLRHVQQPDGGFRNLVASDRAVLPHDASEDCFGRCVWACAEAARSRAVAAEVSDAAAAMLAEALPLVRRLQRVRGWANALLGAAIAPGPEAREATAWLADRLIDAYDRYADASWRWFEPALTYDLGRLPQALCRAARRTGDRRYLAVAEETLAFLVAVQTRDGVLAPVGNAGWHPRGGRPALWDQQSLEAGALVEACVEARAATGDTRHLARARWAFGWYLGENVLRAPMVDPETGACFDGLTPDGPNRNRGAEAQVSYLLAWTALVSAGRALPSAAASPDGRRDPARLTGLWDDARSDRDAGA